jgi:hypothetical protein
MANAIASGSATSPNRDAGQQVSEKTLAGIVPQRKKRFW